MRTATVAAVVRCMCGQQNRLPSAVPPGFSPRCGKCHKPLGVALDDYYSAAPSSAFEDDEDEEEDDDF